MKELNAIVSESGILKSHEEFLEKLGRLMTEYGFDSVYTDSQKVVFDNSRGSTQTATEGVAFGGLNGAVFMDVDSFFVYRNTSPAQYSMTGAAQTAAPQASVQEQETYEEPKPQPAAKSSKGWGK